MDVKELSLILKATIDLNQRTEAENKLAQIHKIIGFAPTLLQLVMSNELELPIRQAGAIYLKNLITQSWIESEPEPGAPIPFNIHEQDRGMIRNSIVEAIIHAPELIRLQLTVCVNSIIKHDFPGRWTQIVDKISIYLQNPEGEKIYGALLCLYQLVKNFEYKKREERIPLNEAMHLLLPMLYNLMIRLLPVQSEKSVLLQKQVLKVFYSLVQYVLPLEIISKEVFSQWMQIIIQIVDRMVPPEANAVDDDEKPDTPWWKCKKWATKILFRIFERYGSPNNVSKEYKEFAEWYLKTFSGSVINVIISVLDRQRRKEYVSPQVLQSFLFYLNQSISHAHSWSFLKNHMFGIIQEVIFPLLCHSDIDEELWETDPLEYIRVTYDSYEDLLSHKTAAQNLLHSACQKRKQILPKTVQFLMQGLQMPNADPKQKDGALCMVGAIADILFRKELYKDQMEQMLFTYVFPEFNSPCGFMRARASWTLSHFAETKFQTEQILVEAVRLIVNSLLTDKELRVKVQAAISLQMLLANQTKVQEYLRPQIKNVTLEILNVIRETKNDDLTNTLQKIISVYQEELSDLAVEMCQHLASTLSQVLETSDGSIDDEYSITAMSLLNTLETIVSVMEDQIQIIAQIRPIVLQVAVHILREGVMEFYEEALSLMYELTCKEITVELWTVLEILYEVFQRDGADYFMDMMPVLHNYITVDTNGFLSNENYLLAIFNMCKTVLTVEMGEDPECHAAKLLEVIILQCKGRIDQVIPIFVELVLQRLMREIKTSELRIMCLQVVIAALYYNPQLLFEILNKMQLSLSATESITSHFIRQWIHDADCFLGLHDRKVCVLGLCTLLLQTERPPVLMDCAQQIIPSMILLFQGLKRAYASKAQDNSDDDSDDEAEVSEESDGPEVLSTDEDEINEDTEDYLESLQEKIKKKNFSAFNISSEIKQEDDDDDDDDDDDEDYDPAEETPLEGYTTPIDEDDTDIDEYILFKNVLIALQERDPNFYNMLTGRLNTEQQKQLQEIILLADQRKSAAESKKIEQAGGYAFIQQTVPASFNFGGTPLGR
ncbi:hypothetical protein PGB90_000647 [Kerria lacca]